MAVDSGVLLGEVLGVVENLADHEAQSVTALTDPLNSVGRPRSRSRPLSPSLRTRSRARLPYRTWPPP